MIPMDAHGQAQASQVRATAALQAYRAHTATLDALMEAKRREQRRFILAAVIWTVAAIAFVGAASWSLPRVERAYQETRV